MLTYLNYNEQLVNIGKNFSSYFLFHINSKLDENVTCKRIFFLCMEILLLSWFFKLIFNFGQDLYNVILR